MLFSKNELNERNSNPTNTDSDGNAMSAVAATLSKDAVIIDASQKFVDFLQSTKQCVINKNITEFLQVHNDGVSNLIERVLQGSVITEDLTFIISNNKIELKGIFTPNTTEAKLTIQLFLNI